LGGLGLADATLTSGGNITNAVGAAIVGHGTINNTILNSGTVRAADGTLVINGGRIDGQSGTIRIDAGASLDLSAASGNSDTDFLSHNGNNLNLGPNDVLVRNDYDNANFGVGNSFDRRANVTGAGRIIADPSSFLSLSDSPTGGLTFLGPNLFRLGFGNIHAGESKTLSYHIANQSGVGPSLRGAIQTSVNGGNLTDARLSGSGVTPSNFGPLAPVALSDILSVTFDGLSAGALTGQQLRIVNNFGNVDDLTLLLTGAAYRYANPTAHAPEPVDFGNFHVGDPAPSQVLSITNDVPADGFSEALNATIGTPTGGVTTNGGNFSLLAPGATNETSLVVGFATDTPGNKSGTATITLASDGTGSSGLGITPLSSQIVNVIGSVFRLASASAHMPEPINFANRHVGDPAPSQTLSITNDAPADGFSEGLDASFGGMTAGVTAAGSFTALAAGATDSSSLTVGIDTATAGNKSGTATITLNSNGAGSSGLGITPLPSQLVNVSGSVYRLASAGAHSPEPVNFGIVHVGDSLQQAISISNTATDDGFSERLDASIGAPTGSATTNGGSFTALLPGTTNNASLIAGIDSSTAGAKTGTATITLTSNGAGTSDLPSTPLAPQTVNLQAQVNNFAVADVVKLAGDGVFSMIGANELSLDFGSIVEGQPALSAELGATNDAAAPADDLAGSFTLDAAGFSLTGFGPFADVTAGATHGALFVELDSSIVGDFSGMITLQPVSTNPRPFSLDLSPITIHLMGSVELAGDHNNDGAVDASDYVVWRKTDGTQAGYDTWRTNFGRTAGSGSGAVSSASGSAVPEPSAIMLAMIVGLVFPACFMRRRYGRGCLCA
jgi:hypothetical protein